jgi:hypothetical protein
MMMMPGGGESRFDSWKHCGVGSFVAYETRSERRMPDFDMLRSRPDIPKGFDIDQMPQTMGVDPKTGIVRHVMTNRQRLVESSEASLVIEVEFDSGLPAGVVSEKHRMTIPAQEPPDEEVRTVVEDAPDSHAEVVRTPFSAMTPTKPPTVSQETLTVAGRTLVCQLTESSLRFQGGEMWLKSWTSPEIPGLIARHEMRMDDQTQTMIVTSFEKR